MRGVGVSMPGKKSGRLAATMGKRHQKKRGRGRPLIHNRRRNRIRIHREGNALLVWGGLAWLALAVVAWRLGWLAAEAGWTAWLAWGVLVALAAVYGCMVNFFRCPVRMFQGPTTKTVVAPADGRVVVIEEVDEREWFHDRRLMVSIFMSPVNVHANWIPCDGRIVKVGHQKGNFMAAWLPKASTENERSMVVIETRWGYQVMARQIAGAMARRIVTYAQEGKHCFIDEHMGFIKFGSRVDVYLPLGSEVVVKLGQRTTGDETIIARLP